MVEAMLRSRRRRAVERMAVAAERYAELGWPVCAGAYPPDAKARPGEAGRACSCDRIGCPAPAAHPVSPAWQIQASADPALVGQWWMATPEANVILVTGRTFDVLDVPGAAGLAALATMQRAGVRPGPVAVGPGNRAFFFVRSRAAHSGEDEWWSCHLDCEPETVDQVSGLRWHCRDSYVLAPPSRPAAGIAGRWLLDPEEPLPDGLRLLEFLADACEPGT